MATQLVAAARRGDLIAVRKAIVSSVNLNRADSQGWTPLFHAAHRGHEDAVKILIQAGADVNHGVETGFTALFSAIMGQHVNVVRILLDAGAKIVPVGGIELRGYALHAADGSKRHSLIAMLDEASNPPPKPGS